MTKTIEECVQIISDKSFFIIDDKEDESAYIVSINGEFKIINPNAKKLSFLPIDGCVYSSKDGTRSDCAIYDENTLCFIELKNCKRTNWSKHKNTLTNQLKATIKKFNDLEISKNKKLEAYSCYTTCFKKNEYTKIKNATNNFETIDYFENFLNTSLYCEREKEFK